MNGPRAHGLRRWPQWFQLLALLAVCYGAVPLLFGANQYIMSLIVAALVIGCVALSWALLGNLGGMVSFGHSAFFGVGAYVSAIVTLKAGVPVLAGMALGGRRRGDRLAGDAAGAAPARPLLRAGDPGVRPHLPHRRHRSDRPDRRLRRHRQYPRAADAIRHRHGGKTGAYLIILTIVLLFALAYRAIRASHYGLALRAMHDSEDATRVVGVNSTLLKGMMLMVSAGMAGVAGAFNAHYLNFLEPDYAFNGVWVTLPIVAAIFGGYRTIAGPVIGALVVYLLDQLVFKALIPTGHQLVLGGLLVAMIIFSPTGLLPLLGKSASKPGRNNHA